ncbi:hypothetical protein [Cupriavidus neocaledonicus]|uniref:Lipoprotein n=1 Tax=Cupriavidus neocaledonicus TaxID=1040979 RepID=A0A375H8X6_9BURK|nr:hypothetical protein [Cupriavidus neocaledonicus]SOZ34866.1 conserved exported hypothetical protein [Cupriavidus neocaledonicus]SPD46660.1 conserved exported protein of unknown function [Cupriavidus neocaledonicus]
MLIQRKILSSCVMTMLVCACSSTPVPASKAAPTPSERLSGLQTPPPGEFATLVVTRDEGFYGSACDTVLSVDGKEVGRLRSGEVARFYAKPGAIILGAQTSAMCLGGLKEREVRLPPASTVRYRISIDSSGGLDLSPTAF